MCSGSGDLGGWECVLRADVLERTWEGNRHIGTILQTTNEISCLGEISLPSARGGFITKINSIGDTLWTKTYGCNLSCDHIIQSSRPPMEICLLAGCIESTMQGLCDGWVIKINPNGDTLFG